MNPSIEYGEKVFVTKGKYKGAIGEYDDDVDNTKASVISSTHGFLVVPHKYIKPISEMKNETLEIMRTALNFYAKKSSWVYPSAGPCLAQVDEGKRARKALKLSGSEI